MPEPSYGDYARHEALDRANLIRDRIERDLLEHDFIEASDEYTQLALDAWNALYTLYDRICAEHLDGAPRPLFKPLTVAEYRRGIVRGT